MSETTLYAVDPSIERMTLRRLIKVCYFREITPDALIQKIEEIKTLAFEKGYTNVVISIEPPESYSESYDEASNCSIWAHGKSLENDHEYKARLLATVRSLENTKLSWEKKTEFYTGNGEKSWVKLIDKYNNEINKLSTNENITTQK